MKKASAAHAAPASWERVVQDYTTSQRKPVTLGEMHRRGPCYAQYFSRGPTFIDTFLHEKSNGPETHIL